MESLDMIGRMGSAGVPAWAGIVFRQEAPGKPIEWRNHPSATDGKTAHFDVPQPFFPDSWAKPDSIVPIMTERTHPLIEAVTEPLANNAERRMDAQAFLGEGFNAAHPDVAEVTARIEAAGQRRFAAMRELLLWVLALAALLAVAASHEPTIRLAKTIYAFDIFGPWEKPVLPAGLTEEQRLLLGDPEFDDLEQKRRLHLLVPGNPAYFVEYAQAYDSENETLPPDFLDTAARIAPDNAFFPYFAAGRIGKESYSKKRSGSPSPPPRTVDGVRLRPAPREMEFDIKDAAAFEEALALVEKASALPSYETHTNQLIAARVRLLPAGNLTEFTRTLMYAYGSSSGIIRIRIVADLLCARAEQLSKAGREEEFLALAKQREQFIAHLGRNPDLTLIGELVYSVIASGTAKNFEAAADRLDLTAMAETYRKQGAAFLAERDLRDIREKKSEDSFQADKASALLHMTLPMVARQVTSPPLIAEADYEPMRMAEHEFAGRLGVFAVALLLPLAALVVFLFRFVVNPMIRLPAKRMAGALGFTDWVQVVGFGVVLPILFFLIVTRHTPLGGRGYGLMHFELVFPSVQHVALLLGLLVIPAVMVRWRLGKRLAPFGFGDRFTVPIALAAVAMIALWSLAALPFMKRFGMERLVLAALAVPPAVFLGLLLANALRSLFGKPASRLAACTVAIAVLPAYGLATILLCSLMPIYSAAEKHWIAQEALLRIDPDAPDLGAYEFKVAVQKRKEINAITGVE
jgi:hypothetical protein